MGADLVWLYLACSVLSLNCITAIETLMRSRRIQAVLLALILASAAPMVFTRVRDWLRRLPEARPVPAMPATDQPVTRHVERPQPFGWPEASALPDPSDKTDGATNATVSAEHAAAPRDAIPDEVVLRFFNATDQQAFLDRAQAEGVEILDRTAWLHAVRVRAPDRSAFDRLMAEAPVPVEFGFNFRAATPEHPETPALTPPATPYVGFGDRALDWLGAPPDNSDWGQGVTVALLDTGIPPHPALREENIVRISMIEDAEGPDTGQAWHGAAVASLLAGSHPDWRGVAPAANLLSIQALDRNGQGDTFTLAKGIVEAVDRGAKVVNLALGAYGDSFMLREAVRYAQEHDVLLIAATGNDGTGELLYPARYEGVMAVGGVDAQERHLYFSNRGTEVDLAAPGMSLHVAWEDDGHALFTGTSAAVPLVSGAAAWLRAGNPNLTAQETANLLKAFANDAGPPGPDPEVGAGILSLRRLAERGKPGIYDIAVRPPHLPAASSDQPTLAVTVMAQNLGTEPLPVVDLLIELNGRTETATFYNVGVGQTVFRSIHVSTDRLHRSDPARLVTTASLRGLVDAYPANNRRVSQLAILPNNH